MISDPLSERATTGNGDNDTSVALCAVGGVPGDGEIPMKASRESLSADARFGG